MIEILLGIAALLLGCVMAWLIIGIKYKAKLLIEKEAVKVAQAQAIELKNELETQRSKAFDLNAQLSAAAMDNRNLKVQIQNQQQEQENRKTELMAQFKNLANEILEEKSKKFTDLNKLNLGEILTPLREKINEFEKKVESNNKESIHQHSALREQINHLKDLNQQITKEASNLTKALKGDSKVQGNWGEYILESILEKSGLVKGREYFVQESIINQEGKRLQPDVIVKLPDQKNLIIDSKVSLVAYERFVSAEDEADRKMQLSQHIYSLRQHIKNLSEKNYQNLYSTGSLDFILLFVPIEPAFGTSVRYDVEIFNDAFEKNIVLVSPSTLIATLRTIASIWKQEYQDKNKAEIVRKATALYEKFAGLAEDMIEIGKQLDRSKDSYSNAMKKLTEGNGNLVRSVENFKKLGIKPSKDINYKLVERSKEPDEEL